jgi:hypothetical protein
MSALYPGTAAAAHANRDFLARAVRFLAGEAGLSQFLDIGTGIPAPGSTHEVAQEVRPESRIVYVDHDPVVLSHARAFLVGREPGTTDYINADLREPGFILDQAARTLDFSRPVGVLLLAILHAIPEGNDPYRIVAALMDALPSGSYLAITQWAKDPGKAEAEAKLVELTRGTSRQQYTARSKDEIARFFDGLHILEPGVVPLRDWRPGSHDSSVGDIMPWLGGMGRKP